MKSAEPGREKMGRQEVVWKGMQGWIRPPTPGTYDYITFGPVTCPHFISRRYVLDTLLAEEKAINLVAVVRSLPRVASLHEIVGSI